MVLYTHTHTHTHTHGELNEEKGITLIALVVTIIVLLILVVVSIDAILGENGIVKKSQTAKIETEVAREAEQINVAFMSCLTEKVDENGNLSEGIVTKEMLKTELEKAYSYGSSEVKVLGEEPLLRVVFTATGREYLVTQEGNVIDLVEITEKINSFGSEQGALGIAADGSIVDMNNWLYEYSVNLGGYVLGSQIGSDYSPAYIGDIVDNKIEGQIPMYIFDNRFTYTPSYGSGSVTYEPILDSDVVMGSNSGLDGVGLYAGEFVPVVSLSYTFIGISDLKYAPEIPKNVINMNGTFKNCVNLEQAPIIPSKVRHMIDIFGGCNSLTGTLKIDANPVNYSNALNNTSINEGCELILTGKSTMLDKILATKSENSNIRIEK